MHPLILRLVPLLLTAVLASCGDKTDDTGTTPEETGGGEDTGPIDEDGDGVPAREDCDDTDPSVGAATTWYADEDSDGYGDDDVTEVSCDVPHGFTAVGGDCDDGDRTVYPGAWEWCDGVDDDCDGEVDEDPQNGDTYYPDVDGDGYGGTDSGVVACEQPEGTIEDGSDCDDSDPDVHPGVEDVCGDWVDNDCNGVVSDGCPFEGEAPSSEADVVLEGEGESAALDVDGVGDVNADGYDDLLVSGSGSSRLFYGPIPRGTASMAIAQATLTGEAGAQAAGAGDLNGDGYDDLLFGDTSLASGGCAAIVLLGPASGNIHVSPSTYGQFLYGEDEDDKAGGSVSDAGDINGDGIPEIIVGAYRESTAGDEAGAAYVVMGPVTDAATLVTGSVKFLGESEGDYAGLDVGEAGDTNGDGLDDVLVGAKHESSVGDWGGAAYLVLGSGAFVPGQVSSLSSADAKIVAEDSAYRTYVGRSVAGGEDVNADGYDDIIVGAPAFGAAGKAYAFYGPLSGSIPVDLADGSLVGSAPGVELGHSVAMAGDVDGDGRSEILVGAPNEDWLAANGGASYLVFGPVSGSYTRETAHASWGGANRYEHVGDSVAGVGDLNADGAADIAFTSEPDWSHYPEQRLDGSAYVMYGLF